jgi:hypothetical protein
MQRTQVLLTEEQHRYLSARARRTGESLSRLVRRAVDQLRRAEPTQPETLEDLLGAFEADADDVSQRHDEYFARAAR